MGVWQVHMHGMVGGISAHAGQSAMADGNTMQENSSVAGQYCDFGWHSCIFVETLPSPGLVHAGSVVFVCVYVCVCVCGWRRARSGKQVDAFTGLQGKAQQLLAGRRCYLLHEDSVYCIKSSVAAASTRQSLSIRQGSSSSLRGSYSRPPKYCSDPGPGLSVTLPPLSAPSCIWLCHHTSSLPPRVPNSLLPAPPPLAPLLPVGNLPHRLPPPPPPHYFRHRL